MSKIQAVILVGEPEDVVKALRDFMGKASAMAVVESPEMSEATRKKDEDEDGNDPRVSFIKRVLTRSNLAHRHTQLLKLLYDAGERGMTRGELVKAMNLTPEGLRGVVGPLGRRVAQTPGHDEMATANGLHSASGLLLKFYYDQKDNDRATDCYRKRGRR